MLTKKIAIDLGTTSTRILVPRKGVVLNEPTVVAQNIDTKKVLAIGREALDMLGKTPEAIQAYYPLKSGVIADFRVTIDLLSHYINNAIRRWRIRRPEAMINVSSGATSTEKKAVLDVAKSAGIQNAHIIDSTVAAALGAGIPISEATGNMIIDIGGGTTEIAVLSLSGIVAQKSIRVGGQSIDDSISTHIRREYSLSIGGQTAQEIKETIGTAMPFKKEKKIPVQGRDMIGGLPKTVQITANELVPSVEESLEKIVLAIRSVMEKTPPELVSDIIEHGIVLTGGVAHLHMLDKLFSKVIGVPCIIAQDSQLCVVKGAGIALTNLDDYKKTHLGN